MVDEIGFAPDSQNEYKCRPCIHMDAFRLAVCALCVVGGDVCIVCVCVVWRGRCVHVCVCVCVCVVGGDVCMCVHMRKKLHMYCRC